MVLTENYTCNLKLHSRYISYITGSFRSRKKISQVFANHEMSHKLLTDQNYRSLIRISRIDACQFVKKMSDIDKLAHFQGDLIKLFGSLKALNCPIQV